MARVNPQFNLGPLIEKEKLKADGSNYADWVHSLRIVLRSADAREISVSFLVGYPKWKVRCSAAASFP